MKFRLFNKFLVKQKLYCLPNMSFISRVPRTHLSNVPRILFSATVVPVERYHSICHIYRVKDVVRVPMFGCRVKKPQTTSLYRFYSTDDYPPHVKVLLPALSPTMEMGTIVSWAKKPGDKLNEGDLLAEIETDKATMGFETPEEGYLAKILVPAGTKDVPIGKLVCIITENEEDVPKFNDYKDEGGEAKKSEVVTPSIPAVAASASPAVASTATSPHQPTPVKPSITEFASEKGRIYASPMARRLAETKNIRLQSLGKGSGLFGSIQSKDLEFASPSAPPVESRIPPLPGTKFVDHPITNIRSVIAKRLSLSKQTIPHYYLTMEVNADNMLRIRTILNKELEGLGVKLSVNDFIIKATALACRKIPEVNSSWMDTHIREYQSVDVSVAVSTRRGLITPIVFDADSKKLREISTDMKTLAAKAREGKLQPHEFQGGTVSVSNLGMYGISHFAAVINPPQAAILAVGGVQDKVILNRSKPGSVKNTSTITVTLSCDHRVVDGAVGAEWMAFFKQLVESPQNFYEELQ